MTKQLTGTLIQLKEGLSAKDSKKGQMHKVFEESFDAKPIYNQNFLLQKIQYIHLNIVRGNGSYPIRGRSMNIAVQDFISEMIAMALCLFVEELSYRYKSGSPD
jgi:hypothetical protein